MIKDSKIIHLNLRDSDSLFAIANAKNLDFDFKRLGSSEAVERGLLPNEELKVIMPTIIRSNPSDPNWETKLANYFYSMSIKVQSGGMKLETGFIYNADDARVQKYLEFINQSAIESNKKIEANIAKAKDDKEKEELEKKLKHIVKTDNDIKEYWDAKVMELYAKLEKATKGLDHAFSKEDKEKYMIALKEFDNGFTDLESTHYKFGIPITPEDYIVWRIALLSPKVANHPLYLEKRAKNIDFYIIDPKDEEKQKKAKAKITEEAMEYYVQYKNDYEVLRNILIVLNMEVPTSNDDVKTLTMDIVKGRPEEFVTLAKDKDLATRSFIEKGIKVGVLSKLANTEIIIDPLDSDLVLGKNIKEAVLMFKNPPTDLKSKVDEIKTRIKMSYNK